MKTFLLKKLVRDSELVWIRENNGTCESELVTGGKKQQLLKAKLLEEARELVEASAQEERRAEFADVFEVLYALADSLDVSREEIEQKRQEKRQRRGGFDQGVYIESVSYPDESRMVEYLSGQPEKYPEV